MVRRRVVTGAAAVLGSGGLLAAAGARRPVIRRWPLSVVQAAPCLPASEVPGAVSLLHAAATGGAALAGGPAGWAAAGLNALAVAALHDLRGDAARSAAAFDAALAGLPPAVDGPAPAGRTVAGRPARRRYLRAADLAYGDDPAHRLDVWGPEEPVTGAPVLVQVHGGGWTGGDKALSASPLLSHLVAHGWVCVTVNYRLGLTAGWPGMGVDVKRALAWVHAHVAEHGGDPAFVAISGGSAGGHLASLAAVTAGDPALQPGFEDADTSVVAAVPVYGVHDFSVDEHGLHGTVERAVTGTRFADDTDRWLSASPLHRLGPGAPPFLVVHGSADTIVSVHQSRRFVARSRELGNEVHYAELPHAQHGFDGFPTARTAHHVRAVHRFLSAVHARRPVTERSAGG